MLLLSPSLLDDIVYFAASDIKDNMIINRVEMVKKLVGLVKETGLSGNQRNSPLNAAMDRMNVEMTKALLLLGAELTSNCVVKCTPEIVRGGCEQDPCAIIICCCYLQQSASLLERAWT